jgi:cytochrome b561
MSLRSTDRQWGSVAKFFHWIMALAILVNGVWGLLMTDMKPSMSKISVYALHKSIGLTVLALFLLRLLWRAFVALPLSGWWFNSLRGFPLQWFKLFNLPAIAGKNEDLARLAHEAHELLFWALLLVLVAHVGAALKHHVFDNDNVLRRMLPFGRPRD